MATNVSSSAFWSDNLQESIQIAGRRNQTLLCFVTDGSASSLEWDEAITTQSFSKTITSSTVRLRIQKDSQEFAFLNGVCPVQSTPSLVSIKNGQIEEKLEHPETSVEELKSKLSERYSSSDEEVDEPAEASTSGVEKCLELKPSTGRMRLSNNAYDALRSQTEKWQAQSIAPKNILLLQLRFLEKIPSLKETVTSIKSREPGSDPVLPESAMDRLLNTSASAVQPRQSSSSSTPTQTASPPAPATTQPSQDTSSATTSHSQAQQRASYIQLQRNRETAQRQERERIKQQIQNDRIERRRLDAARNQPSTVPSSSSSNTSSPSAATADIRIQVRTFDGSTLRRTFPRAARIASDIRPWVDEHQSQPTATGGGSAPYNLKLILTPLPNRTIEAGEEDQPLPELGIVGSATFVMVPVRGYVDSYAGAGSGVVTSVFGGILGAGGKVVDGLLGIIGWGGSAAAGPSTSTATPQGGADTSSTPASSAAGAGSGGAPVKIRTLADQRADEERKKGTQLYNGNSLDFQGRRDKDAKPGGAGEGTSSGTSRKDD